MPASTVIMSSTFKTAHVVKYIIKLTCVLLTSLQWLYQMTLWIYRDDKAVLLVCAVIQTYIHHSFFYFLKWIYLNCCLLPLHKELACVRLVEFGLFLLFLSIFSTFVLSKKLSNSLLHVVAFPFSLTTCLFLPSYIHTLLFLLILLFRCSRISAFSFFLTSWKSKDVIVL